MTCSHFARPLEYQGDFPPGKSLYISVHIIWISSWRYWHRPCLHLNVVTKKNFLDEKEICDVMLVPNIKSKLNYEFFSWYIKISNVMVSCHRWVCWGSFNIKIKPFHDYCCCRSSSGLNFAFCCQSKAAEMARTHSEARPQWPGEWVCPIPSNPWSREERGGVTMHHNI